MEDTNVGQGVEVEPDVIRARLSQLEQLLGELDAVAASLADVRRRQGPAMWSSVGVCEAFAQRTSQEMQKLSGWLAYDRAEIGRLRDNLHASWRTHEINDQEIEDRLVALANKIESGPPSPLMCTPYDDPGPEHSPTPAPTPTPTPSPSGGGGAW